MVWQRYAVRRGVASGCGRNRQQGCPRPYGRSAFTHGGCGLVFGIGGGVGGGLDAALGGQPARRYSVGIEKLDGAFPAVGARADGDRLETLAVVDFDPPAAAPLHAADVHEFDLAGIVGDHDLTAEHAVGLHRADLEPVGRHEHGAEREPDREQEQGIDRPAFAAAHDSVAMLFPQPGGEPENVVHPLELIEPVGCHCGDGIGRRGDRAGGARGSELRCGRRAIGGERAVTVEKDRREILAEKAGDGHALSAADLEMGGDVGQGVAVEEPEVDRRGGRGEVGEDRALVHTVAAPGASEHQHRHLPHEAGKNLLVCWRERHLLVKCLPTATLIRVGMPLEKRGIGERGREGCGPGFRRGRRSRASDRMRRGGQRDGSCHQTGSP